MSIFFIVPKINLGGGGSNSNTDLRIRALLNKGYEVKVVTLFSKYNKLSEQNKYEIITYNSKPKLWILVNFLVYKILKKYESGADLFYIDGPQFLWGAGLYKLLGKKPIIIHLNVLPYVILEHGTRLYAEDENRTSSFKKIRFWLRTKIGRYVDIYFARKINSFTCTSPIICEQCMDFGFNKNNLEVLPEFIDIKIFRHDNKERVITGQKKHLLYVGRLVPCKGVDLLLKAVGDLKRDDVILDIVGDGPELAKLKMLSKTMGLEKCVYFHGWTKRDDLKKMYWGANIFVHPARWAEPLGITVVEAIAAGLPVIIPQISGSAWAAGKAGLTFKNGDGKDLLKKITMLLDDDVLYNKLQSHTREEAEKMDYKQWIKKFESLITKLTSSPQNSIPMA